MPQDVFEYSPSKDLMASSPKVLITLFLLGRYNHYLDKMDNPVNVNIDTMTAALLSTMPNPVSRDALLDKYTVRKDNPKFDKTTASLLTTGDWFAQISEVLEFTETSTGSF